MDMDSTLINEEGIDLLAQVSGVGEAVAALTDAAMHGKRDFYTSLRARTKLLAGQSIQRFREVRARLTFTDGAEELIRELKSRGWRIGVVSGGFHEIIDPLLEPLELDLIRANRFVISGDLLTGEVQEPIIGPLEKATTLKEFAKVFNIPIDQCVAIGDGANDREMVMTAGVGVAFCAKPALKEVADIAIEERDLRILLDHI